MNIISKPVHATAYLWSGRDLAGLQEFVGPSASIIPSGEESPGGKISVAFVAEHMGFQIAKPGDYVVREATGTIRVYDEAAFNAVYAEAS